MRGLLLLDVDGPLNPAEDDGEVLRRKGFERFPHEDPLWLNPAHGARLREVAEATGLALAWCTSWEDEANQVVAPALGLPPLPVIRFRGVREWKFAAVRQYAAGRPLAWFDDDFALFPEPRVSFERARAGIPTLLHAVDPLAGLADEDFAAVITWAETLTAPVP